VPRASEQIDDRTPLSAARIDVAARVGWLLRVHRTAAGLSLRQMSTALGEQGVTLSAATLSRTESEGQRSPQVLDGYGRVLGLAEGSLRAEIDAVCRAFSYAAPRPPEHGARDLAEYSRACDAVRLPAPTGSAWLAFARQHAHPRGFGLPSDLMEPLVRQLAGEVGRGVARARLVRHEALNILMESPYASLVTAVLREAVDDPGHQNFYDLTSVLSDHPTDELVRWAGELLSSPSIFQVRGGAYALQGMFVSGYRQISDWRQLMPLLERAWYRGGADPARRTILTQVCRTLPGDVRAELSDTGVVAPGDLQPPVAWSRTRSNPHYRFATSIAHEACTRLGHPDEPLLERLVFEAFFEPRGVRMSTSTWLLSSSPFAGALVRAIFEVRDNCPDPASRAAALRVATVCHAGEQVPGVEILADSGDPEDFAHGTAILGRAGQALSSAALARGLAGDETALRQTLYCLGMAGDGRLHDLARDPMVPATTARAAQWWLQQGSRILV
jgi:hypothetical protein